MNGLQPLSLTQEIGVSQDDIVHVAHTVQVLVFDFPESLGLTKGTAVEGNESVVAPFSLESEPVAT